MPSLLETIISKRFIAVSTTFPSQLLLYYSQQPVHISNTQRKANSHGSQRKHPPFCKKEQCFFFL